ncbi:MAG: putative quinol monooxygenase [Bryobacteraceae bacterium]
MTSPLFIFARFDPLPGQFDAVRDELLRVLEPTRAEPGCRSIHLFESAVEPRCLFIHSEWVDEAAFEAHARLPHVERMVTAVEPLIAAPLRAVRTSKAG